MINKRKQEQGTTLIEVLVAVFILSIGALGTAQLQVTGIKGVVSSFNLTSATMLATDLMERMQNNSAAVLSGDYNLSAVPASTTDCASRSCTASELAAYDFKDWRNRYPAMMTSGSGEVSQVAGTNEFAIIVRWDDDRSGSTEKNCPPRSALDLDCYQLSVRL
jgi:type IV pilus assembly protein PilV